MKNKVLSIVAGVFLSLFSIQSNAFYECDQVVEMQSYDACYNYGLKATLWVAQKMSKSDLIKPGHDRDGIRFYEEQSIPKKYRATLADYRRSGFDRGHLASNASFDHNPRLQKETFSLVNITPQYPNMNRGIMRYTEKLTRKLAISNGSAVVITGNVFDEINPKRIGPGRIAVPKYTYKILKFPNGKNVAFLIPNIKEKQGKKPSKFRVDINEITKLTGFDFR